MLFRSGPPIVPEGTAVKYSSDGKNTDPKIMGIIATISDMSEQIVSSCQMQSQQAAEVNQSIENINQITADNFVHIAAVQQSSREISTLAIAQEQALSHFALNAPEAAAVQPDASAPDATDPDVADVNTAPARNSGEGFAETADDASEKAGADEEAAAQA